MAERKNLLLFLIADLLSDDRVFDAFLKQPEKVMAKYALGSAQRCALLSIDPERIAKTIADEVHDNIGRALSANYPVPEPRVTQFSPDKVGRVLLPKFEVSGEALMKGAVIVLLPAGQPGAEGITFPAAKVTGTFQNTVLTVTNMDLRNTPSGKYRVAVKNCQNATGIHAKKQLVIA